MAAFRVNLEPKPVETKKKVWSARDETTTYRYMDALILNKIVSEKDGGSSTARLAVVEGRGIMYVSERHVSPYLYLFQLPQQPTYTYSDSVICLDHPSRIRTKCCLLVYVCFRYIFGSLDASTKNHYYYCSSSSRTPAHSDNKTKT